MRITKYGHSCILVEEGGLRILIDPGNFVFMDGKVKPEDFKNIDIVLLTHEHQDHTFIDALKIIVQNNHPNIITNKSVGKALKESGIPFQEHAGNLPIKLIDCPHGLLPEGLTAPENTGFLIGGKFLHPGDCIAPREHVTPEILSLPVIAPWVTLRDAISYAKRVNPKAIIPIHDGFLKYPDFINGIIRYAWPDVPLQGTEIGKPFEI